MLTVYFLSYGWDNKFRVWNKRKGILQTNNGGVAMKKQLKCYIYTRVSTSMQVDGYSLDAQKDKLHKYADY